MQNATSLAAKIAIQNVYLCFHPPPHGVYYTHHIFSGLIGELLFCCIFIQNYSLDKGYTKVLKMHPTGPLFSFTCNGYDISKKLFQNIIYTCYLLAAYLPNPGTTFAGVFVMVIQIASWSLAK